MQIYADAGGSVYANSDVREWVGKIATHIRAIVGGNPEVRIMPYRHGRDEILAVDYFCTDSDSSIACTIIWGAPVTVLGLPDGDTLEIVCVDATDALHITKLIAQEVTGNRSPFFKFVM